MSPTDQKVWEKLLDKVPTTAKDFVGILIERFLTAKKSTQYAIGSAGVLVLALLFTASGGDGSFESSITFEARRGGRGAGRQRRSSQRSTSGTLR